MRGTSKMGNNRKLIPELQSHKICRKGISSRFFLKIFLVCWKCLGCVEWMIVIHFVSELFP